MATDITGMFGNLGVSQEDLLRAQGIQQAQIPAGRLADVSAPQRAADFRRSTGGMFGVDTRTDAEKAQEALKSLDLSKEADQQTAISILSKVNPVGALALADEFQRRKAAAEDTRLMRDQEQQKIELQKERIINERAQIAANKDNLTNQDKKYIEGAASLAEEKAGMATRMYNIGQRYEQYQPPSGFVGKAIDTFNNYMGNQGDVELLRTEFNSLKNSIVLNQLPPGAASDKDVALAMKGWPDEYYNAEAIASFLRGQAKLAAIAAEKENEKAKYLRDNKGDSAGFLDHWRKKIKEEGFEQNIMSVYDFKFEPIPQISADDFFNKPSNTETPQQPPQQQPRQLTGRGRGQL